MKLGNMFKVFGNSNLLAKIQKKQAKIGVIGIGYVGQALVDGLVSAGFTTLGFDLDHSKLSSINHELFIPVTSAKFLQICDVICICVPTPIDENQRPDLTFLVSACEDVASLNKKTRLIVVESTVAPGTLRNVVLPILEKKLGQPGGDFYLAISPERIDPGNKQFTIRNTPKVVGGLDSISTTLTVALYSSFVEKVVPTSTPEIAELSKMLENTFRLVNISLMNEVKGYADAVGIDIWEAIETASTKPFGFMPHYPGPGIGGHCIPVDPVYLLEHAKDKGFDLSIVRESLRVNEIQPKKVVEMAKEVVNGSAKGRRPRLLLLGIAYKPNSDDTRESPGVKILHEAEKAGFEVSYFDPHVPKLNGYTSKVMTEELVGEHDVVVIAADHKEVPYEMLTNINKPIIDTRNIMRKFYSTELIDIGEKVS